jgi:hypothetical protein
VGPALLVVEGVPFEAVAEDDDLFDGWIRQVRAAG